MARRLGLVLKTLQTSAFAINGRKSDQDVNTYVFCGNVLTE